MDWFPHGKINLSLYITGKRADGYHSVDTIYWPLPLYDYLRLEPSETPRLASPVSALESPDNLVLKAWQLMRELYGIPPVAFYLEKGIPWEAGLGGGSGDGAAALLALNRLFRLGLTRRKLCEIGARLGADVPACIMEGPTRGRGSGAEVESLPSAMTLPLLIVKPPQGFSTPAMYRAWDEKGAKSRPLEAVEAAQQGLIQALAAGRLQEMLPFLHNDFESVLEGSEQAVREQAAELLEGQGAVKSLLCGSGSGVFGLWETEEARQEAKEKIRTILPEDWQLLVPFAGLERGIK